jgi:hypothetical protein
MKNIWYYAGFPAFRPRNTQPMNIFGHEYVQLLRLYPLDKIQATQHGSRFTKPMGLAKQKYLANVDSY